MSHQLTVCCSETSAGRLTPKKRCAKHLKGVGEMAHAHHSLLSSDIPGRLPTNTADRHQIATTKNPNERTRWCLARHAPTGADTLGYDASIFGQLHCHADTTGPHTCSAHSAYARACTTQQHGCQCQGALHTLRANAHQPSNLATKHDGKKDKLVSGQSLQATPTTTFKQYPCQRL